VVDQAGIQALVGLVVGDRIERLRIGPAPVVAVDDLAEQPEVGRQLPAPGGQWRAGIEVDDIGRVESKASMPKSRIQLSTAPEEVLADGRVAS